MFVFTMIAHILAALVLTWAFWLIVSMMLYIRSGQYETDKRLREICR